MEDTIEVKIKFDKECTEIIEQVPAVLRNTMINIALKHFSRTEFYKEYFCQECDKSDEPLESEPIIDTKNNATGNTTAPQAPVATVAWDDFS